MSEDTRVTSFPTCADFLVPMEKIETVVIVTTIIVTTKRGRVYKFSFNGDYSLDDYLKRQSFKIGTNTFIKVKNKETYYSNDDVIVVNIDGVETIKIDHEFSETN